MKVGLLPGIVHLPTSDQLAGCQLIPTEAWGGKLFIYGRVSWWGRLWHTHPGQSLEGRSWAAGWDWVRQSPPGHPFTNKNAPMGKNPGYGTVLSPFGLSFMF